jgi:hypothetical protein
MRPLLSAFCDGEAGAEDTVALREHLRACGNCRATLRAYRAAPGAVAALAPSLPLARSLLGRAHDALAGFATRFGGGGGDPALSQTAATGGGGGAGIAALAKAAAICLGTAGGTAACVATGLVPAPAQLGADRMKAPAIERVVDPAIAAAWDGSTGIEDAPAPTPDPQPSPPQAQQKPEQALEPEPEPEGAAAAGAVEYEPEPEHVPVPEPVGEEADQAASGGGNPAGEFGP